MVKEVFHAPQNNVKQSTPTKGKGKAQPTKGKGKAQPTKTRVSLGMARVTGKITEWKGTFGWIRPSKPLTHAEGKKNMGRVYIALEDVEEELPSENADVSFTLYSSGKGAGAAEVRCAPSGKGAGAPGVTPKHVPAQKFGGAAAKPGFKFKPGFAGAAAAVKPGFAGAAAAVKPGFAGAAAAANPFQSSAVAAFRAREAASSTGANQGAKKAASSFGAAAYAERAAAKPGAFAAASAKKPGFGKGPGGLGASAKAAAKPSFGKGALAKQLLQSASAPEAGSMKSSAVEMFRKMQAKGGAKGASKGASKGTSKAAPAATSWPKGVSKGGAKYEEPAAKRARTDAPAPNGKRSLLHDEPLLGTVKTWKGKFGWITPHDIIDHPKAKGKDLYFAHEDVESEIDGVGGIVSYMLYEDGKGCGAMNVNGA